VDCSLKEELLVLTNKTFHTATRQCPEIFILIHLRDEENPFWNHTELELKAAITAVRVSVWVGGWVWVCACLGVCVGVWVGGCACLGGCVGVCQHLRLSVCLSVGRRASENAPVNPPRHIS
jgi:hypothetical protein